jgi:two-component system NarL family sensor kinase
MIEEQEDEAARVERALHDEISQMLTAAGFELEAMRRRHEASSPKLAEEVVAVQRLFESVLDQVRSLSQSLPPSALNRAGLPVALEKMVARYRGEAGPRIRLMQDNRLHVELPVARALHRIAELALDNAVRHSEASKIEVLLRPTGRGLVLEIRDDGRGFEQASAAKGLGLELMRLSAEGAGLEYKLESHEGAGTIVFVRQPNYHARANSDR